MLNTSDSSNESAIDILTDDCLINIFQYLPIIDRIRAEAVSKKWQNLIQKSWTSLKHFNFGKKTWTHLNTRHLREALIIVDDEILKSLLTRFGRYLISIDLNCEFSLIQHKLTPASIERICQFCIKLQALNLGKMFQIIPDCQGKSVEADDCECEPGLSQIINTLQDWKHVCNLKKFGIEVLHGKADNISALISKMKSLESLYMVFEIYYFIEGSYLSALPIDTLQEIIFEESDVLEETTLIEAIQNIPKPHTLILMELRGYNVLRHLLPSQSETIKNLALGRCLKIETENLNREIQIFRSFINLERLNLNDNVSLVKDELLLILGQYCKQLNFLDISGNSHITDSGIQHVVSLPKLQYLFMKSLPKVTGKTFRKMNNLEFLECYDCLNLEDEGLCAIIRQSKLRLLNVEKSSKVTNKLLNTVIEELNTRTKLNMIFIITDTNIDVNQIEKLPPLLRIAGSYEFYFSSNKMREFFPKMGPFGLEPIDLSTASEHVWRMSDGSQKITE